LIEDKKDFIKAVEQIRLTPILENKIKYIREYGQQLMKNEPNRTLALLKRMVTLSTFRRKKYAADTNLTPEEKEIFDYLNLPESDKERLGQIAFPKPDDFFHFFVTSNIVLEDYLDFLKRQKYLAADKSEKYLYPIFHKMFEYHLEQYTTYYNKNAETIKYRMKPDEQLLKLEKAILELLEDPEHEKKYDKNHILVLFKMYKFGPGIVSLCEKMNLREELLSYYIEREDFGNIIRLCERHGEREINLWVQALKFFSKLSKEKRTFIDERTESRSMITEALMNVNKIDNLSPLLVLNILGKTKGLKVGEVKDYFRKKLHDDISETTKNNLIVKENYEAA